MSSSDTLTHPLEQIAGVDLACEVPAPACDRRPRFNLTCVGCGHSVDLCRKHTLPIVHADATECMVCLLQGPPRKVIAVVRLGGVR
jgi:hypothetical protein